MDKNYECCRNCKNSAGEGKYNDYLECTIWLCHKHNSYRSAKCSDYKAMCNTCPQESVAVDCYECNYYENDYQSEKMTEGDYIRSLNDEQLAEYIFKIEKNARQEALNIKLDGLKEFWSGYIAHPHDEDY